MESVKFIEGNLITLKKDEVPYGTFATGRPFKHGEVAQVLMYDEYSHLVTCKRLQDGTTFTLFDYRIEEYVGQRNSQELGAKYDEGKTNWTVLLHGLAKPLAAVAAVLNYGMQKYAADSWQEVPDAHARYEQAFYRHIMARASGETYDDESGLPHLAHIVCNGLFLIWFEMRDNVRNWTKFNPPPKKD